MRKLSVPFELWPAREQRFWRESIVATCERISDTQGACLSNRTIQILQQAFEQWISFLRRRNLYSGDLTILDHLNRTNARQFVDEGLQRKKPQSVRTDLSRIVTCFRIAYGRDKIAWARELALGLRRLEKRAPARPKPIKFSSELFRLGLELMRDGSNAAGRARTAIRFRDGLMISILAARPVRLANLSSMRLGKHLVMRGAIYWLHFSERETKTGLPISFPLPSDLTVPIRTYLSTVRPRLAYGPHVHDYFWPSLRGGPLSYGSVYRAIASRTLSAFRHRVSPHRFRHAAATSLALFDPDHVGDVHMLLGQSSRDAAERHYIHGYTDSAAKRLQVVIESLRQS